MISREIAVFDDFLPAQQFKLLLRYLDDAHWTANWKSRLGVETSHSNAAFTSKVERQNRDHQDDTLKAHPIIREVWERVERLVLPGAHVVRAYANRYLYGQDGAPHRDSREPQDRTALLYAVDRWHVDWAGETIFFEHDEPIKAVLPKPNRLVVFPADILHVGRGVYPTTPIPRTVLVFKATYAADGTGKANP